MEWTVELRPSPPASLDGRRFGESLSFFGALSDPDGIEDVERIWLVEDRAELAWTFSPSSWIRRQLGQKDWIGAVGVRMADGSALPRGAWRMVVADQAGNRAEFGFRLEASSLTAPLPRLALDGELLTIDNPWPETYALAYDATGALLRSTSLRSQKASLESLFGSADRPRIAAIAIYGYDPSARLGVWTQRQGLR